MIMVYQILAHDKTETSAAESFARNHFERARQIDGAVTDNTFRLVDGIATYKIMLVRGDGYTTSDLFKIYRK